MNDEIKDDGAAETPEAAEEKRGLFGRKRKKLTMKEQIREIMPLIYVLVIGGIGYGLYFGVTYNWAAEFELKDQRNNVHTVAFPSEKPMVIAFSDRESGEQLTAWVLRLMGGYGDKIESHRIADFSKLDPAIKPLAPGFLVQIPVPILVDMEGEVAGKYRFQGGEAALFVVSPTGTIKARLFGEFTEEKWAVLKEALDPMVASAS